MDRTTGLWARGEKTQLHEDRLVPLVTYGESCLSHREPVAALSGAGLDYAAGVPRLGYCKPGGAVRAGVGVMPLSLRSRVRAFGLMEWGGRAPAARLPYIFCGIYGREGNDRAVLGATRHVLAAALHCEESLPRIVLPDMAPVEDVERPAVP